MSTPAEFLQSGLTYYRQQNLLAAEQMFLQAVAADARFGDAHHLAGVTALQLGRPNDAVNRLQAATGCPAPKAEWFGNLGTALCTLQKPDEAVDAYNNALKIDDGFVDAWFNLATTFRQLERVDEADRAFREALARNPQHAGALNNLGTLLREQNRSAEALDVLQRAAELPKANAEAWYNYSNALRDDGRIDEQLAALQEADRRRPNMPRIRSALGLAQLTLGQYESGWAGYEWRLRSEGGGIDSRCQPIWDGGSLDGRRIAVFAEQGFGDVIPVSYTHLTLPTKA